MRRHLFLLALLLLAPSAGWAGTASYGCQFTGVTAGAAGTATGSSATKMTVSNDSTWCYNFVAADAVTSIIGPLHVTAESVVFSLDADLFQAGVASTVRVIPRRCPMGAALDTTSLATISRSCGSIGGANGTPSLEGSEGAASVQNGAIRAGPGTYYFEINVVCEAGDTCQIAVKGESTTP